MFSGNEWLILVIGLLVVVVPLAAIVTIAVVAARRTPRGVSRHESGGDSHSAPAAGWFADPAGRHDLRYWDGARWTDAVVTGGDPASDPL